VLREYLGQTSVTEAALRLGVIRAARSRISNGKAAISADMAVRLSILIGACSGLWAGMKSDYDLWQPEQTKHDFVVPLTKAMA
jgi:addiction module HigA family antidote